MYKATSHLRPCFWCRLSKQNSAGKSSFFFLPESESETPPWTFSTSTTSNSSSISAYSFLRFCSVWVASAAANFSLSSHISSFVGSGHATNRTYRCCSGFSIKVFPVLAEPINITFISFRRPSTKQSKTASPTRQNQQHHVGWRQWCIWKYLSVCTRSINFLVPHDLIRHLAPKFSRINWDFSLRFIFQLTSMGKLHFHFKGLDKEVGVVHAMNRKEIYCRSIVRERFNGLTTTKSQQSYLFQPHE